jgi:hypothetical protein
MITENVQLAALVDASVDVRVTVVVVPAPETIVPTFGD